MVSKMNLSFLRARIGWKAIGGVLLLLLCTLTLLVKSVASETDDIAMLQLRRIDHEMDLNDPMVERKLKEDLCEAENEKFMDQLQQRQNDELADRVKEIAEGSVRYSRTRGSESPFLQKQLECQTSKKSLSAMISFERLSRDFLTAR